MRTDRPRRTQAERRRETGRRIAEATVAVLARNGYSGTTIAAVAEAAGVSRGATLHYYPHKIDLVAGVLAELISAAMVDLDARVAKLSGRWTDGLDFIYDSLSSELGQALFAAQTAARVNEELHQRIEPSWMEVLDRLDELTPVIFGPKYGSLRDRPDLTRFVVVAIRGQVTLQPLGRQHISPTWPTNRARLLLVLEEAVTKAGTGN